MKRVLKSALYPAKTIPCNKYSYTKFGNLNMDDTDFPTPISQISKVEKLPINVYKYKILKIDIAYISNQPKRIKKDTSTLISEVVEKEAKYRYCWIKNLNRLLFDQNEHKCKTYFCDRCLYGFTKGD